MCCTKLERKKSNEDIFVWVPVGNNQNEEYIRINTTQTIKYIISYSRDAVRKAPCLVKYLSILNEINIEILLIWTRRTRLILVVVLKKKSVLSRNNCNLMVWILF